MNGWWVFASVVVVTLFVDHWLTQLMNKTVIKAWNQDIAPTLAALREHLKEGR